jgi:apolipoprotein N-acyltransferase
MSPNGKSSSEVNQEKIPSQHHAGGFGGRLKSISTAQLAWLWLLAGFLLLPFTAWQTVIPLAAWLAPVFLLRYARTSSRPRLVAPFLVAAYTVAILIDWHNGPLDTLSITIGILMSLVHGLLYMLPYLADKHIGSRLGAWGRLFVFPLAFTTIDWGMSLLKSVSTAGSPAYSQSSVPLLPQVISITGMWGITFLIMWFATTLNALWEHQFHWRPVRAMLGLYAGVLLAVFFYGGLRLALTQGQPSQAATPSIKVATITNESIFDAIYSMDLGTFYRSSEAERAAIRPKLAAVNNLLFARIESALQAGAIIVGTQETAGLVLEEDKPEVLDRAAALARQFKAYLELSLWVFTRTPALPYVQNQTILIDPSGQVDWTYDKTYPVFGGENFIVIAGTGELPVVDTPYGRLSTAICNDLHFPALLRQASQKKADILIAPFNDDPVIDTQDPAEAAYRTIENGFSLIRAAGRGTSMISDPEGRLLASQDYFTTDSHVLLVTLPVRSEKTIYSRVGDLFVYLCVAGLVILTAWAFILRKRMEKVEQASPAPQANLLSK